MDKIISEIKQQVPFNADDMYIHNKYIQNNESIPETILDLLNLKKKSQTIVKNDNFTKIRKILDDKDKIYNQRKKE